jgi:hypothetical protein
VAGNRQVVAHDHPARTVGLHAELRGDGRGPHPGAPDHVAGIDAQGPAVALDREAVLVDTDDTGAEVDLDAHLLEVPLCSRRELRREGLEHPVAAVDQDHPGVARIDAPEVAPQGQATDLRDGPGHLHSGGPGPHDREGERGASGRVVRFDLCLLEGTEKVRADLGGLGDGLEARCVAGPLVLAEVVRLDPGRHDEVVVGVGLVAHPDGLAPEVDVADLGHHHFAVLLSPEHLADRGGDLGRRQRGRGHLVEQGLEDVVVLAVEEQDVQVRPGQRLRGLEAAEAAADEHDTRPLSIHQRSSRTGKRSV